MRLIVTPESTYVSYIHIYRSLLRSASYLPTAFLQNRIISQIKHDFRLPRSQEAVWPGESTRQHCTTRDRFTRARLRANILKRAVNGHREEFFKVLKIAYGRTGRRKRELLRELNTPQESDLPLNHGSLAALVDERMRNASTSAAAKQSGIMVTTKFEALIRSQAANPPTAVAMKLIKHLTPQIPEENIWGRSVPLKRQKNIRKNWLADTMDRLLPPIPEREWNELRDLATGRTPIVFPSPRARGSRFVRGQDMQPEETLEEEVASKLRRIREPSKVPEAEEGSRAQRMRSLRRHFAAIWNQTPKITEGDTGRWIVTWGGERSAARTGVTRKPMEHEMELFAGLEDFKAKESKLSRKKRRKG